MEIVLLAVLIGLIPAFIAYAKGRTFIGWWFFGAMLFIVALPIALLMGRNQDELDRRSMSGGRGKRCPSCAEIVRPDAAKCRYCQADLTAPSLPAA